MSVFAAYIRLDGRPIEPDRMQRPLRALEGRGQDGARHGAFDCAGFAHRLMLTTDDDQFESQPYSDPARKLVFAGSVRLFNRDELGPALGLDHAILATTADGELAFLAYRKWGPDCVEHLIGDYGFVVWNSQRKEIFAATDPFARRPVYYHLSDRMFAAASSIAAVTCHPEVPRDLDKRRIAALAVGYQLQPGRTYIEAVSNVPPGHTMHIRSRQPQIRRYWHPQNVELLNLGSRDAFAEAYRALLSDVTAKHLRGIGPAALMFSGGLDSSSLAAAAKPVLQDQQRPLIGFAGVAPERLGKVARDARPWAELVGRHLNLDVRYITSDGRPLLSEPLDDVRQGERQPWQVFGIYKWIYEAAHQSGARILVDGIAGDYGASIKAHGAFMPALRRGKLLTAFRDARQEWHIRGRQPALKYALRNVAQILAPRLLVEFQKRRSGYQFKNWLSALRPGFLDESGLSRDFEQTPIEVGLMRPMGARAFMLRSLEAAGTEAGNLVDFQQEYFGLENRQPFSDRRLIEFALATPEQFHFQNGWNRALSRAAMTNDLPQALLQRTETNSLAVPDLPQRFLEAKPELLRLSYELERSAPFSDGVNWDYVRKTLNEYDGSDKFSDMGKVIHAELALSASRLAKIAAGGN